jgi:hypothetical protein
MWCLNPMRTHARGCITCLDCWRLREHGWSAQGLWLRSSIRGKPVIQR